MSFTIFGNFFTKVPKTTSSAAKSLPLEHTFHVIQRVLTTLPREFSKNSYKLLVLTPFATWNELCNWACISIRSLLNHGVGRSLCRAGC